MKLKKSHLEAISFIALYLLALYIWTLPMHNDRMPFGDVDASSHFMIGDYMVSTDKSVAKIPYYAFKRYGGQNEYFPEYIWYPPQYWTNTAIAQVLGGERIFPTLLFIAVLSSLIIVSSFFLIRNLFGFWPAFLSSFLLIFSARDYMIYLWGQWPQSLSFAFTPLALYSFYAYFKSYKEKKPKAIYLYILSIILSAQFLFHPQGLIVSVATLIIYSLFIIIKTKKIPFNIKHVLIAIVLFSAISALSAPLNIGEFFASITQTGGGDKGLQLDKLFKWYQGIKGDGGLPDFYFTYNKTHGSFQEGLISWWTLPFLLIGLVFLFLRRNDKDLVLLSWFISFYILTRLSVIGMGQKDMRMFAFEAHVFYPIITIGLLSLASIIKQKSFRQYLKYGLIALFLILAINVNGKSAYTTLNGMQNSIGRINPMQYEAAEWIKTSLPEKADVYVFGTVGYQYFSGKIKWFGALSQRGFITSNSNINSSNYIIVDYTDAILLRNQDYINLIQNFEKKFENSTPIYNKNNIRVYKVA